MKKEEILTVLDSMAKRYFPDLKYEFKGFYYEGSPTIADIFENSAIKFNEKHHNIRTDQLERVLVHELQHIKNEEDYNENNESDYVYGFILHSKFQNLYRRLEEYYKKKFEEGTELSLKFAPLPQKYEGMGSLNGSYMHPIEVLARLKGYEHYLNQVREGIDVETLAFESIEAFREDDLKFLDIEYRKELTGELRERNPEVLVRGGVEPIVIEESDLTKPTIS
jgi:hypothetical protein